MVDRLMETYEETGWSAMSNLDVHLQALENDVAQEFRDPQSDMCELYIKTNMFERNDGIRTNL